MAQLTDRLLEALARPISTPEEAEAAARAAEALAAYLRGEEAAKRALAAEPAPEPDATGTLAGLYLEDAAELVLKQAGLPLHVKELGKRIKAGGWRHPRSRRAGPEQINFQLAARLPKHPDRFRRVAPNTFGLAGWEKREPKRARPRSGLFRGPGGAVAESIGERPAEPAQTPWRSS